MKNGVKRIKEVFGFGTLRLCMVCVALILVVIFYDIFSKGIQVISWEFLTKPPVEGMTRGGIFPAILGTFFVTVITAVLSVPLGMGCAVYLNEYARDNGLTRFIRLSIRNLSGVPSIVYGLFGVSLFVDMCHFGTSILSAGFTLGLMTLPLTITASEEALKTVPRSYREGALALGATKWQSIRTNVLPFAVPGMLTGTILGLSRAAGETAPILFTGAAFFLPDIPNSIFSQFMALPYHLYIMSTQHHNISLVRPIAYGTALVLIVLVFLMNLVAIIIRYRLRKEDLRMDKKIRMQAKNIDFYYGAVQVLKGIDLDIFENNVTAIIGPSGCGKSTFIRLLNRMHELVPNARLNGLITLDGNDIVAPETDPVDIRRKVGMVFQKPNPFPKSIFENIAYGLQVNGNKDREFIEQRVIESLKKAALWEEVKGRLNDSALRLSGGQQQRLCIARCLAIEPEVILFDEPCASLDPISTHKVEALILELKKDYTIVIVTHNMQQAARVSDYTGFFYMGELVEFDKTEVMFTRPKDKRTEDYITGRFG